MKFTTELNEKELLSFLNHKAELKQMQQDIFLLKLELIKLAEFFVDSCDIKNCEINIFDKEMLLKGILKANATLKETKLQ